MGVQDVVSVAIARARDGVEYGPNGATCPLCGQRMKVTNNRKDGHARVRYHRCVNTTCVLCSMGSIVKSVQGVVAGEPDG